MTLRFAEWFKGGQALENAAISPIGQDWRGLGPVYLQAGGKEILVDMVRDFDATVAAPGARVRLDVWEHKVHEFHVYGDRLPESRDALARLREAIDWATNWPHRFAGDACTECDTLGDGGT